MIYQFLPYYGKFPNYFQIYLDSLIKNVDVLRILIITDIDTSDYVFPSNVSVHKITFDVVKARAANFLANEFQLFIEPSDVLHYHYKLCEFKPIYHKLFKDILDTFNLTSNDYFGWGDCDLVYGKLSNFLDNSKRYDMIGIHGHFTALRYDEPFISKYKEVILLLPILLLNRYCYLDEQRFIDILLPLINAQKINYFPTEYFFCDIIPGGPLLKTFEPNRTITHFVFDKPSGRLFYNYEDGELREAFYAHLQKRKMTYESKEYLKIMITKDAFLDVP